MSKFYKCIIIDKRQYYTNSHGKKEYLTGDNQNDKTLLEAALLTGTGLNSGDVINETFGETLEEADKAAKAYVCANWEKFQKEGIKFGISVPEEISAEMSILDLEKKYSKKVP